jgi:hypothetical protein
MAFAQSNAKYLLGNPRRMDYNGAMGTNVEYSGSMPEFHQA